MAEMDLGRLGLMFSWICELLQIYQAVNLLSRISCRPWCVQVTVYMLLNDPTDDR